jgi:hypothetical protein
MKIKALARYYKRFQLGVAYDDNPSSSIMSLIFPSSEDLHFEQGLSTFIAAAPPARSSYSLSSLRCASLYCAKA